MNALRRTAAYVVLLFLLSLVVAPSPAAVPVIPLAIWTPVRDLDGATGDRCDLRATAGQALARLGERRVIVAVWSQTEVDVVVPAGSAAFAEPTADGGGRVILSNEPGQVPCRYAWATVAHEMAHVWQYRACRCSDVYAAYGTVRAEILADCAAALTGWPDYRPYLTDRQHRTGQVGCTTAELATAAGLRVWSR
jgi:hypothetical protein